MKIVSSRTFLFASIVAGGIVLFFAGRSFIFWKMERAIISKMEALQTERLQVRYNSLHVNYWNGNLSIKGLDIQVIAPDSVCSPNATIGELSVDGTAILPLLLKKELNLTQVIMRSPSFHHVSNFRRTTDKNEKGLALKGLHIGILRIDSGTFEAIDSASCKRTLYANLDFELKNLSLRNIGSDSATWSVREATAAGVKVDLPTRLYSISLKQFTFNGDKKQIKLDSMRMVPSVGRAQFAKSIGHQIDQFTCVLPALQVDGFEIRTGRVASFSAQRIAFGFQLNVFRDKRYPRLKRKPTVLPSFFLQQLPYRLQLDTIAISSSFISYEEHPEEGEETGKIFFNRLVAGIYNVSNDSTTEARMNVRTRFMDAGVLKADFTFPPHPKMPYTTRGSLTDFSLPAINPMVIPAGNIKIESGMMNEMNFSFRYNDYQSEGELEVRYTDLKLLSLRKDKKKSINAFVSLIIGVFVQKDMNEKDTKDKRTGAIKWERDTQKGVLNYWWKSVLSGIKGVYNLEKL